MTNESTTADPVVTGNGSANPESNAQPLRMDAPEAAPEPTTEPNAGDQTPVPIPPANAVPEWFQQRFNELAGKRHEAERTADAEAEKRKAVERTNAELLEKLSKVQAQPGATPPVVTTPPVATQPVLTEEEVERRAGEKAKAIAQATRFNEACNDIVETGKKEYKDWDQAVKNLSMAGAIGPADKVSTEFLETVIELNNPHQILHTLGMNPEEAARIAALPPKRMALELARVEANLAKPADKPPVSQAPTPLTPISGRSTAPAGTLDDPTMKSDDWFALRQKQIEEKRNRYRRA